MRNDSKDLFRAIQPDPDEVASLIRNIKEVYLGNEPLDESHLKSINCSIVNTPAVLRAHTKKRKIGKLQRKARRLNRK